ncbi:MAG TPA: DNA ligase D [Burkholderiaceae bacterium]|nr:DNA ligase D [Burkholderiaceae bacterium]
MLAVREGKTWRYAGRVGTGFNDATLNDVHARLRKLETREACVTLPKSASARGVHWVRPQLVAEVSFAQWTKENLVRQAVFQGLRHDKPAIRVVRERAMKITHADRVIDPSTGFTKGDLVEYFAHVSAALLPHVRDRPVSLVRAPEGIEGPMFFQKHAGALDMPHVRMLDLALDPGHAALMTIDRADALCDAAQMNVVELHTWNATARFIDTPDRFVLDLDPDPTLPWQRVREAAVLVRGLLDELGLRCFLKTTGGHGLHVVVPLGRRDDWNTVKTFSHDLAAHLARTLPDRFSARPGPRHRVRKIFVDYLRNQRGATTVSAFSPRARLGLPVSVPIAWDELDVVRSGTQWNIATVPERLRQLGKDNPWDGYARIRQTVTRVAARLKNRALKT